MTATQNMYLVLAGVCSFIAALAHLACIAGGPTWYLTMGAGERMAQSAARGHWYPTFVTIVIAGVLSVWGLYALSGAGTIRHLPLLKPVLCAVMAVHLVALYPGQQGLRHAANFGRDRFNRSPQRRILAAVFLHHGHRPLTHFGGKPKLFDLVIAPFSQEVEPPQNPGRFTLHGEQSIAKRMAILGKWRSLQAEHFDHPALSR